MEITLNVNINAPALIEFFSKAIAAQGAAVNVTRVVAPSNFAEAVATKTQPAPETVSQDVAAAPATEGPRPPKARAKAAAPAPVADASAPAVSDKKLTIEEVRNRLTDYSADKRFGMPGVIELLAKYGVQKITALPEDRYADFKKDIDDALAGPTADPLA